MFILIISLIETSRTYLRECKKYLYKTHKLTKKISQFNMDSIYAFLNRREKINLLVCTYNVWNET